MVRAAYGEARVEERHRHRYEVNNAYREQLEAAGLVFSGTSPDNNLVEFVELPADVHPYYVSTQAHPELRSRPDPAAPAVRRAGRGRDPAAARAAHPDRRERPASSVGGRRRGHDAPRPETTPTTPSARRSTRDPVERAGPADDHVAGPWWAPATSTATTGWWRCARTSSSGRATPRRRFGRLVRRAPGRRRRARGRRRGAGLLHPAVPPRRARPCSSSSPPACCDSDGRGPAGHRRPRAAGGGGAAGRALATPARRCYPSAGITTELHHLYLARGLSHADRGDFELHAEEAELEQLWVPFEELLDAVLDGRVREGPLAAAVLAYDVLRTPRRA